MHIGVPKEIKDHEYRVGLTPSSVQTLTAAGHEVMIQSQAGEQIGLSDDDYRLAGGHIAPGAEAVFDWAELIIKVKEPQLSECRLMRAGQTIFSYLHLAAVPDVTAGLVCNGSRAIAYETVTAADRSLPLLIPMSEVAGRLSVQAGAHCLEKPQGGRGSLLSGAAGVAPATVVIIGGGTVGVNAANIACGMGAEVVILDNSEARVRELAAAYGDKASCFLSTADRLQREVLRADLVIGAVLLPGAAAPKLLNAEMVRQMNEGTVMVDVAIDQGGCFQTSKPTTHQSPTYIIDGVVHYCVTNMPGIVPRTSTFALNNATLPYILKLANQGIDDTLTADEHFRAGLNVDRGRLCHPGVIEAYAAKPWA